MKAFARRTIPGIITKDKEYELEKRQVVLIDDTVLFFVADDGELMGISLPFFTKNFSLTMHS